MIIGIDLDDVLKNTFSTWLTFCNQLYGENFHTEQFIHHRYEEIWNISSEEKFLRFNAFIKTGSIVGIPPLVGAQETVTRLAKDHQLHIITARSSGIAKATHEWISRHFPEIFKGIHFCSKDFGTTTVYHRPKHIVCKELGVDLLIDDHPENILLSAQEGIRSYLFDQPWNRTESLSDNPHITRIFSWQDEVIKNL